MTKETKHTPGPWWRDDEGFIAAGKGDDYVTVASPNCSDMDIDEREANARLIAAAPDLLEAWKDYFHAVAGESGSGVAAACKKARAAIKATAA